MVKSSNWAWRSAATVCIQGLAKQLLTSYHHGREELAPKPCTASWRNSLLDNGYLQADHSYLCTVCRLHRSQRIDKGMSPGCCSNIIGHMLEV